VAVKLRSAIHDEGSKRYSRERSGRFARYRCEKGRCRRVRREIGGIISVGKAPVEKQDSPPPETKEGPPEGVVKAIYRLIRAAALWAGGDINLYEWKGRVAIMSLQPAEENRVKPT
jgi:hypothetical protein